MGKCIESTQKQPTNKIVINCDKVSQRRVGWLLQTRKGCNIWMVGQVSNTFKPKCSLNFVVKISRGTQVFNVGGWNQTLF